MSKGLIENYIIILISKLYLSLLTLQERLEVECNGIMNTSDILKSFVSYWVEVMDEKLQNPGVLATERS